MLNPYRNHKSNKGCFARSGPHPSGIGGGHCQLPKNHKGFHRISNIQWAHNNAPAEYLPQAYTDYPVQSITGDLIRKVQIISWDGDKYAKVRDIWTGFHFSVKVGYLYTQPGILGEVPNITTDGISLDPTG